MSPKVKKWLAAAGLIGLFILLDLFRQFFPFGMCLYGGACLLWPRTAWLIHGGWHYMPVEPPKIALHVQRVFGILLIGFGLYNVLGFPPINIRIRLF